MATAKVEKTADVEKGSITFKFADGGDPFVFDLTKVPESLLRNLALHGASQKLGDGYAGMKAEADPIAFARTVVRDIAERLYAGDWRAAGTGGARTSILLEAFATATGKTVEEVAEMWANLDDDDKKAIQAKPKFQLALAKIKVARETAKIAAAEKALAEEEAAAAEAGETAEEETTTA
jgi:hypothetical protein